MKYRWVGWYDGDGDCEPPEPGKFWIEIVEDVSATRTSYLDSYFEEVCIIVHRTDNFDQTDPVVIEKERRAQMIADALNSFDDPLRLYNEGAG